MKMRKYFKVSCGFPSLKFTAEFAILLSVTVCVPTYGLEKIIRRYPIFNDAGQYIVVDGNPVSLDPSGLLSPDPSVEPSKFVAELQRSAQRGDPIAQWALAKSCDGKVPCTISEQLRRLQALPHKNPGVMFDIAMCYLSMGATRDGVELLRQAAGQGGLGAMDLLANDKGWNLHIPEAVESREERIQWGLKAASLGSQDGITALIRFWSTSSNPADRLRLQSLLGELENAPTDPDGYATNLLMSACRQFADQAYRRGNLTEADKWLNRALVRAKVTGTWTGVLYAFSIESLDVTTMMDAKYNSPSTFDWIPPFAYDLLYMAPSDNEAPPIRDYFNSIVPLATTAAEIFTPSVHTQLLHLCAVRCSASHIEAIADVLASEANDDRILSKSTDFSKFNIPLQFAYLEGTPLLRSKAIGWYTLAVSKGSSSAQRKIITTRAAVAEVNRDPQLNHAYQQGLMHVASVYRNGDQQVPANRQKALQAAQEAWKRGCVEAASFIGQIYLAPPADKAAGVKWLQQGAAAGDVRSSALLGEMYLNGTNVPRDTSKAVTLLTFAANHGDSVASVALTQTGRNGIGVKQDESASSNWQLGNASAASGNLAAGAVVNGVSFRCTPIPRKNLAGVQVASQLHVVVTNEDGGKRMAIRYNLVSTSNKGNEFKPNELGRQLSQGQSETQDFEVFAKAGAQNEFPATCQFVNVQVCPATPPANWSKKSGAPYYRPFIDGPVAGCREPRSLAVVQLPIPQLVPAALNDMTPGNSCLKVTPDSRENIYVATNCGPDTVFRFVQPGGKGITLALRANRSFSIGQKTLPYHWYACIGTYVPQPEDENSFTYDSPASSVSCKDDPQNAQNSYNWIEAECQGNPVVCKPE